MTKAQREKAERLLLKGLLEKNPKLKETIDNMIDNPNPDVVDAVTPVIEDLIRQQRMIGTQIGWAGAMLQVYGKIKDCQDLEEAKAIIRNEADAVRARLNIDGSYFDSEGNVIVENGDNDNE